MVRGLVGSTHAVSIHIPWTNIRHKTVSRGHQRERETFMFMTTHVRRMIASVAALVAVVAVLAPATAGASSGSAVKLKGEATTLRTDPGTTKALISNGILPLPVQPASVDAAWWHRGLSLRYAFPIIGGRVDATSLVGRI